MHVQDSQPSQDMQAQERGPQQRTRAAAGRPDEQQYVECLGDWTVALKDGKGFGSVREGSHTEKDQQLDAANYNEKHSYKQKPPGGAGLSVMKS